MCRIMSRVDKELEMGLVSFKGRGERGSERGG